MGKRAQSSIARAIDVQRKFELLLTGQATAHSAVSSMLIELSEVHPEIRTDVDQVTTAIRQAAEAQEALLEKIAGLTNRLELIAKAQATKH